jgi:type IV pilus assembly protein PilY1
MTPTLAASPLGALRERPLWARSLALLVVWTLQLQPAVSLAALSQVPQFTVTSVPPNVMLMFDDSGSMNQLVLNVPPGMTPQTYPLGAPNLPALKLNTVGYYGVSGDKYFFAGSTAYDNRWRQGVGDVLRRSPAFNPLAYNPAVQYKPWNNNGTRMPNASYGGNTNVAAGANAEWDMRNLPPSMGGGTVAARLAVPKTGWIPNAGMPRALSSTPAGSVRYERLTIGNTPEPAAGADLFNGTIVFDNPDCGTPVVSDTYGWTCPSGSPWLNPAEVCNALNVGMNAAARTCCTNTTVNSSTAIVNSNRDQWFTAVPPGPPVPAMTGPAGEVCNSILGTGATRVVTGLPPCTTVDDPPYVAPCAGGGGELCIFDPPPDTTCTGTRTEYQWRCNYDHSVTTSTTVCNSQSPQVCSLTGTSSTCPGGVLTPTSNAVYVSGYWTPARYVVYDGPATRTPAEVTNLNNYRLVMVDRKFGWNGASRNLIGTNIQDQVSKWFVVDGVTGLPSYRPDCDAPPAGTGNAGQNGTWCTFEQEAQNYANWFTYYRSRLFAAVGVMSEVLSNFVGPEQFMRMGYGRINYFKGAMNPWNVGSVTDIPYPGALPNVDGQANEGGVERGVRPFTVFNPPASATPNADRAQVFNWLFTINGLGPTPNRETLHGTGLYFSRTDSRGPWGAIPGSGNEPVANHLWCRRNYTVLATDGEWTKLPTTFGFTPQRLLERAGDFSTLAPVGSPSASQSVSVAGPAITGSERLTNLPLNYQYVPASEPHIATGSGSTQSGTLSDVLLYYWSRDLRSDLRNSFEVSARNRAFWQHMSTYVVGYGVSASMDDPAAVPPLRTNFDARNAITWPDVGLEDCRQLDDNVADAAIPGRPPCAYTNDPGNRINDTLRGALSSGGDFFSANSPAALRAAMDAVFAAINSETAAGTAPTLSSSTLGAGNVIIQGAFETNTWEGSVRAYDQLALVNFLVSGGAAPVELWTANFPAPNSRNIYTTTAISTAVPFDWASLSAGQKTVLDVTNLMAASSPVLNYLRGEPSQEQRFGGPFRNRFNTVLGDVVNSTPLYSKAVDHAYHRQPAGSFTLPLVSTQGYSVYGAYVTNKKTVRHPVVLFGANDGMFHVLDARVAVATSGQEKFAFVPRAIYPNLEDLSSPAYTHRYFVDGPVIEGDVWNGSVWKTIAIGTTGAGRAGVFAIDVTSPESGMNAANVLWDIVPAQHASALVQQHLGSVLQPGYIGSVHDSSAPNGKGRWVYITGNGLESVGQSAALLIFDVFTGALIKAITTGVGSVGNENGITAITPIYDGARNIVAIYGGDKRGNLWKFDLSSDTPNDPDGAGPLKGWEIFNETGGVKKPLFQATNGLGNLQPLSTPPRIMPHPLGGLAIGFGTGKLIEPTDPSDMEVQAIYMLWDQNNVVPITKAQLQQITLQEYWADLNSDTLQTSDEIFRKLKASDFAAYDWNDKGFYLPLIPEFGTADGERVVAAPIIDAGVMAFTSFAPTTGTDQCVPGGHSFLYRLNLAGNLCDPTFAGPLSTCTIGLKVQPGLVSTAPPIYDPVAPGGATIDSMTAADVKTMLQNPKYKQSGGRAVKQGATGDCAHVGLRVDGARAYIPTICAGLMPMRSWRPVR